MKIEKLILGNYSSNCYIISDKEDITLIDPGSLEVEKIINYIVENNLNLKRVLLTHGHFDHIAGLKNILKYFKDIEIVIGIEEVNFLNNIELNLSYYLDKKIEFDLDKLNLLKVKENDIVDDFYVIDTPGHTIGSKTYYLKNMNVMFVGDFIFENTIGRTDFLTGDFFQMKKSIKKILTFKDNIIIMSGHGRNSTIGDERKNLEKILKRT